MEYPRQRFGRWIQLGIDASTTSREAKSARVSNAFAIVCIGVVCVYVPVFAALDHPIGQMYIPINLLEVLLFGGTLVLNAFRRYRSAAIWQTTAAIALIGLASWVFGTATAVYYYLLTAAVVVPVLLLGVNRYWETALFTTAGLAAFLWFHVWGDPAPAVGPSFQAEVVQAFAYVNISGVFVLTFLTTLYAHRSAATAEDELQEVNSDLERRVEARTQALQEREAQLQQAQKMEAVGRLAGGIAHEFNNMLVVIIGYAELILGAPGLSSERQEDLRRILAAAWRAEAMTKRLLQFSRHRPPVTYPIDLNDVVREAQTLLERSLREDVTTVQHLDAEPLIVDGDANLLLQSLVNLALNASDAMPNGGTLTITTYAVADVVDTRGWVLGGELVGSCAVLEVRDSGVGMDEASLRRACEPYYTTKAEGEGSGLGLTMVYATVQRHGGGLALESEPGRGTTVRIVLPRATVPAVPLASAEDLASGARATASATVLLVEDEVAVRAITAKTLRAYGHDVLEADTIAAARQLWSQRGGAIDLLVSDVVLPDGRGPALGNALRERCDDLGVLYISGYSDIGAEVVDGGPRTRFLQKPFRREQLAAAVRELLDEAPAVS